MNVKSQLWFGNQLSPKTKMHTRFVFSEDTESFSVSGFLSIGSGGIFRKHTEIASCFSFSLGIVIWGRGYRNMLKNINIYKDKKMWIFEMTILVILQKVFLNTLLKPNH